MERWSGRVAIVTGAASGIGAAITRCLVRHGMRVVGVDRMEEQLKIMAEELEGAKGQLYSVQGDVTKEEDVIRVVKFTRDTLGGADVLVNNAGVYSTLPLPEIDTEKLRKILEINILGMAMFTREVVKDMRERGSDDGHIFNMGSVSGQSILEFPGGYMYSATKHAVRVMTEGLRRELRDLKTKIRVTELSPGVVRTNILVGSGEATQEVSDKYYDNSPSLDPQDIADALLYALSAPAHVQVHEITLWGLPKK